MPRENEARSTGQVAVTAMNADVRRILLAQALRAAAYGFGAVLLGASLEARGWSSGRVGLLFTAVVAGTALMSVLVGTTADRIGRRRTYVGLFVGMAAAGAVFALSDRFWALALVALSGTLSTEVVESGPFTSLEQAMLPSGLRGQAPARAFGVYNAVATIAGSAGALAAGGPALLRDAFGGLPADQRFLLVFVPAGLLGAVVGSTLSRGVEAASTGHPGPPLRRSRSTVFRLGGLFAVDSFAGGFVVQSFLAYWFRAKFGVCVELLGLVFFAAGILQAGSFMVASRLAERFGLLNTMVFTHLPSNLLLAAVPLAPSFPTAIALLLGRYALSQMDVPTRQAYITALVDPEERTAAAAYTNSARYLTRPLGPALAGVSQQVALGLPFFLGGGIKVAYDLALWSWFRRVPIEAGAGAAPGARRRSPTRHAGRV
ncbi:MAG TPA: MFS transporter [Dehalococcoidia bacterium]|nr:MFS transporter [Dehalococcoidia bacterium]